MGLRSQIDALSERLVGDGSLLSEKDLEEISRGNKKVKILRWPTLHMGLRMRTELPSLKHLWSFVAPFKITNCDLEFGHMIARLECMALLYTSQNLSKV